MSLEYFYQKSPTIWRIKSHNSGMKNWNFTIKYTDRKTINSNNSVKFEVNWSMGSSSALHLISIFLFQPINTRYSFRLFISSCERHIRRTWNCIYSSMLSKIVYPIAFSINVSAFHPLLLSLCSIIRIFVATWWRFWLNPVSDRSNLSDCMLQKITVQRENANITCMDKSRGLPKRIDYFWQHTRIDTISCSGAAVGEI
jgi:hypothetical protein